MTDQNPETVTDEAFNADLKALLEGLLGDAPAEAEPTEPTPAAPAEGETACASDPIFDPDNKPEDKELIQYLMEMVQEALAYVQAPPFMRQIAQSVAHQHFHNATDPETKKATQRSALLYKVIDLAMEQQGRR